MQAIALWERPFVVNTESIYGFTVNCGFFVLAKKGSIFHGRKSMKEIAFLKKCPHFLQHEEVTEFTSCKHRKSTFKLTLCYKFE
jgi:hypothetical protein